MKRKLTYLAGIFFIVSTLVLLGCSNGTGAGEGTGTEDMGTYYLGDILSLSGQVYTEGSSGSYTPYTGSDLTATAYSGVVGGIHNG